MQDNQRNAHLIKEILFLTFQMGKILLLSFLALTKVQEIGALAHYISDENVVNLQPMNANFGIIEPLERKVKGGKIARNEAYSKRSLEMIDELYKNI